jgi:hypothetical protein
MMYSTYSSINSQLQSSALGQHDTLSPPPESKISVEKIEKTLSDTKNQIKK